MSTTKVTDALRNVTAVDAAKITTGTIPEARITSLDSTKLTGTVDIARLPSTAVNSNVDLTTLSASNLTSGTVATARLGSGTASSSTFLRGDSTYAEAGGGGKVLQVIAGTIRGESFSSTSASWVDVTSVNATITPSSTSSKVLVMMHAQMGNGTNSYGSLVRVVTSTSTETFTGTSLGSRQSAWAGMGSMGTGSSVDSSQSFIHAPSTTSSITYKMQVYCESGGTARIGTSGNNGNSSYHPHTPIYINLMELDMS